MRAVRSRGGGRKVAAGDGWGAAQRQNRVRRGAATALRKRMNEWPLPRDRFLFTPRTSSTGPIQLAASHAAAAAPSVVATVTPTAAASTRRGVGAPRAVGARRRAGGGAVQGRTEGARDVMRERERGELVSKEGGGGERGGGATKTKQWSV